MDIHADLYPEVARDVCRATRHAMCAESHRCEEIAQLHSSTGAELEGVGVRRATMSSEQPSGQWTTAELLKLVAMDLKRIRVPDRLRRDTFLTVALGRLAERGLSPDAIVRTGFGRSLLNWIMEEAVVCRSLVLSESRNLDDLPRKEWVELLLDDESLNEVAPSDLGLAMVKARNGLFQEVGEKWLREAPMAHLIGWKLSGQQSPADEDDLYLLNGPSATEWICERFTRTYLDEWSQESLVWEIAYASNRLEIESLADFDCRILRERRISIDHSTSALAHRLSAPMNPYNAEAVRMVEQAREKVFTALDNGDLESALRYAEDNVAAFPNESVVRRDFGFCLIGQHPQRALATLELHRPQAADPLTEVVYHFNVLAATIRSGQRPSVESYLRVTDPLPEEIQGGTLWMWNPESLASSPFVEAIELETWRQRMLAQLDSFIDASDR